MGATRATSSFAVLRRYLQARASFTERELAQIEAMFTPKALPSGEHLQRAGTVATHAAFVASGCLRTYVIDEEGKEHVVKFAPETWWVADAVSLATGTPTRYFVQALEDSEVLLITGA